MEKQSKNYDDIFIVGAYKIDNIFFLVSVRKLLGVLDIFLSEYHDSDFYPISSTFEQEKEIKDYFSL